MIRRLGLEMGRSVLKRTGRMLGQLQETAPLRSDLLEGAEEYRLVFDAPGAEPTDVQVRYVDGEVLVRLDRFRPYHEGYEMRFPGRGMALDGRARLPADAVVEPEAASATLRDDGTLEVRILKADAEEVEAATAETTA